MPGGQSSTSHLLLRGECHLNIRHNIYHPHTHTPSWTLKKHKTLKMSKSPMQWVCKGDFQCLFGFEECQCGKIHEKRETRETEKPRGDGTMVHTIGTSWLLWWCDGTMWRWYDGTYHWHALVNLAIHGSGHYITWKHIKTHQIKLHKKHIELNDITLFYITLHWITLHYIT